MANDNWSPFYPTVFYPAQESTSLQRQMSSDLQTIVRNLSRIGQSQPQTQIVKSQPQTLIVQQDPDAAYQAAMLANDLRERLGEGMIGLRESLSDLSSQIEWGFESLNESITAQTNVLLTIAKQQTIPAELNASEYLANAREMVNQLRDSINSGRLDESKNERLFEAADKRFKLAIDVTPSSGLMYAILLGRAELHILVKKNVEALAILEENLIYAPKDETFDSCSYLYRLMGRIVFMLGKRGSRIKAEGYLGHAIHLSPGYAIAWYDRAQYFATLAPLTGAELAVSYLRHAIEMNEGFMLLASIEPNFDPIRKEVDAIQQEIRTKEEEAFRTETEKMKRECLTQCNSLELVFSKVFRLGHNFWQIKKLADEIIPWVRNIVEPSSPYPAQSWDTGRLVARGAGDLEKLSLLRTRTLTADSRDDVVACLSEANCMYLQLSGELDILQKQWKFWQDLERDAKWTVECRSGNITHLQSKIAEYKHNLAKHDKQKPRLSKNAQKHTGLTRLEIKNLAKQYKGGLYLPWQEYYTITDKVEDELLADFAWREGQQGILHWINVFEESIGSDRNQIACANQFLEQFEQLSRA